MIDETLVFSLSMRGKSLRPKHKRKKKKVGIKECEKVANYTKLCHCPPLSYNQPIPGTVN